MWQVEMHSDSEDVILNVLFLMGIKLGLSPQDKY
jgi:hypothetical protein